MLNPIKWLILVFSILMAVTHSASAQTASPFEAAEKKLRAGTYSRPDTFVPLMTSVQNPIFIVQNLYEGLLTYNRDGQIVGGLAQRWEISSDKKKIRFYIRENLRWSDGSPITAESLRKSYLEAIIHDNVKFDGVIALIAGAEEYREAKVGVEAVGIRAEDSMLEFEFDKPTPAVEARFSSPFRAPIPDGIINNWDQLIPINIRIPSSGPYRIAEVREDYARLERNPYYRDADALWYEEVIYWWGSGDVSQRTLLLMVHEKQLDIAFAENVPNSPENARIAQQYLNSERTLASDYYSFNTLFPPLDALEVRRALTQAIDYTALAENSSSSLEPIHQYIPPYNPHIPRISLPYWRRNSLQERVSEARTILAKHGYDENNPLVLRLAINPTRVNIRNAQAISAMWHRINVHMEIIERPLVEHYRSITDDRADHIIRAGWVERPDLPLSYLQTLLPESEFNYGSWQDEDYVELVRQATLASNAVERSQAINVALNHIQNEFVVIPLFEKRNFHFVSPEIDIGSEAIIPGFMFHHMRPVQ